MGQEQLTEREKKILLGPCASQIDIFMQGVALYLSGDEEDGFHKVFEIMRKLNENKDQAEILNGGKARNIQRELNEYLISLKSGSFVAWSRLLYATRRHCQSPFRQIILKMCPFKRLIIKRQALTSHCRGKSKSIV